MKKKWRIVTLALALCLSAHTMTALAEEAQTGWQHDGSGWRYLYEDGDYEEDGWAWLDGNWDGIEECYYFDSNGYLITGTMVGDSVVNSDGAWMVDGEVQKRYDTGFIKKVYLNLLGKSQEEVERVLGTEYLYSENLTVGDLWATMDYTLNGARPEQLKVTLLDGYVERMSAEGVALFNAVKDRYSIAEISNSLGITAKISERGGATWYLNEDMTKFLSFWDRTYTLEWY